MIQENDVFLDLLKCSLVFLTVALKSLVLSYYISIEVYPCHA